jgi:16S rRNA (cytosine967-C5)-methyltransferase
VPTPSRALALDVLDRLESPRGTLADALAAPAIGALAPRDRALLHELVLGTLRRRGWIDHVLARLVEHRRGALDPSVRNALRLGAYQLLYLRVAPHAAVSESVDLARQRAPRASGLVNAVLRRLQREGPPEEPDPAQKPLAWLSTAGSLPPWLAERWLARLGPTAAVERARVLLEPPPVYFRFHPRRPEAPARLAADGIEASPALVPGAWRVEQGGPLGGEATSDLVYVQDQGSQLVAHLAASDGLVLDACAAPGGKSLLIADLGGPRVRVIAAESSRRRLTTLAGLARRWKAPNVLPLAADAARPPFRVRFDSVLLDAPCSGLGTLARHPDIRWRLQQGDVARHAARQRTLLEALAPLVREGGHLVYATCSVEDEESLGVVSPFLEAHPEFSLGDLPSWSASFRAGPHVRMDPLRHRGDAFFATRLERR